MTGKIFQTKVLLCLIIFLGLILRVVWINSSPPSLYGDELTIALDANSLLKTGQDQLGNSLPLTFPMGAGRPAGYVYGSIPFIAIFGPTPLGVKSLSILSGLGIIILLYLVGSKLFTKKVGLAAAFIAAVSPWDISLSRGGFEAHFALFLTVLGVYLFMKTQQKPLFYIFSALSFGLTLHTYPTYKVSLLLFLPLLFWYRGIKNIFEIGSKKYFFSGVILFLILAFVALSQTFIAGSEKRFSDINILSREEIRSSIEQKIIYERNISSLPKIVVKFFHNKPVEYAKVFIENYLQNFSMDFLIVHGDRNPRHNMATMGQFYFIEFILFFVGLLSFWQKSRRILITLLIWLILAPIPAAIVDLPHALRSSFMLPPLIIISSLGLYILFSQKKVYLSIFALMFLIQFFFFTQKLYFLAPAEYSHFWSYSAKLASETALKNKKAFDYVILSDRIDAIEFAYPVYAKIKSPEIIEQNKKKTEINGYSFKKFDNVYVGNISDANVQNFIERLKSKVLYIGLPSAAHLLKNYEILEGLDKKEALVIEKI